MATWPKKEHLLWVFQVHIHQDRRPEPGAARLRVVLHNDLFLSFFLLSPLKAIEYCYESDYIYNNGKFIVSSVE